MRAIRAVLLGAVLAALPAAATAQPAAAPGVATASTVADIPTWISEPAESPDGRLILYRSEDELHVYDRATGRSAPTGLRELRQVAWSPRGDRIAFVRRAEDGRWFAWTAPVDPATGLPTSLAQRVSTRPGGAFPAFSPDGATIALVWQNRMLFTVPANGGRERVLHEGAMLGRPQWSRDGRSIYLPGLPPGGGARALLRVPAAGGAAEVAVRDLDGAFLGLAEDGETFGLYQPAYSVVGFRNLRGEDLGTVVLPPRTEPAGWTRSGKLLAVHQQYPSSVFTIDMGTDAHRSISGPWSEAMNASFSPDGSRIVFQETVNGRRQLIMTSATGGDRRPLRLRHEPLTAARWSPDGHFLAFVGRDTVQPARALAVVLDTRSGEERALGETAAQDPGIAWRSDSRSFVRAHRLPPDSAEYREFFVDGRHESLWRFDLMARPAGEQRRVVTADWIAFTNAAGVELRSMRDGTMRRLHENPPNAPDPGYGVIGVSPGGTHVAMYVGESGPTNVLPVLKIMPLQGGTPNYVKTGMEETDLLQVEWTPDGRHLVARGALKPLSEERSLRLVSLEAGTWRDVGTRIGAIDFRNDLSVSPDGRTILVSAESHWAGRIVELDVSGGLGARGDRALGARGSR